MWKIINNIAATRPTSHSKINAVLDVNGNLVNEPKEIGNAMNKNFVSNADNLIKKKEWILFVTLVSFLRTLEKMSLF